MNVEGLRVNLPPHKTFPFAEGLGIFVGIVAWDLLVDGHMQLGRSVLIATFCSLIWFAVRCWRGKARNQRRRGSDVT